MGYEAPNNRFGSGNVGHSSTPVTPIQGRGAMPTGDRFNIASQPMAQPPSAVQPGKGEIPIRPPGYVEVHIPDLAGFARPPR
jgi:hypothetical protein